MSILFIYLYIFFIGFFNNNHIKYYTFLIYIWVIPIINIKNKLLTIKKNEAIPIITSTLIMFLIFYTDFSSTGILKTKDTTSLIKPPLEVIYMHSLLYYYLWYNIKEQTLYEYDPLYTKLSFYQREMFYRVFFCFMFSIPFWIVLDSQSKLFILAICYSLFTHYNYDMYNFVDFLILTLLLLYSIFIYIIFVFIHLKMSK